MHNTKHLTNALSQLGLTPTEAVIYLQLQLLGTSPASTVARRADINRSTTRYTLENLAKRRLCIQIEKNGTLYFTPEDPEKILLLLRVEKQNLTAKETVARQLVNELKHMQNPHIQFPKVQFYEGAEGVKKLYTDVLDELQSGDTFLSYCRPVRPEANQFGFYDLVQEFVQLRRERNITNKLLIPEDHPMLDDFQKNDQHSLRKTRSTPMDLVTNGFALEVMVTPECVAIFCVDQTALWAYMIRDVCTAQIQLQLLTTAWENAVEKAH